MEDSPISFENILEEAPKWTFDGDFKLLQWMKEISQDLENRGKQITEALTKLDINVKSTSIALDNVANSLTTLQFGNQFVECRVQDDDDTHVNPNEASMDIKKQPEITSKEMLNIFLDNNLKVLRNCYEKYSIDLEDSDDEENCKERTCIYRPINPYNEKPLPFIFGSKDWHSKWHVGLYENQQENSYSGDEISEVFSETSSTSHLDDNESFESNTEWASSNSVDNDNLNTNFEIKNASSLRGSQPMFPSTPIPINPAKITATIDESSSISTISSSVAKKSLQSTKQQENLTQNSESINSTNSRNVPKTTAKPSSKIKENTLQYKSQPPQFVDLFDEPPEDIKSTTSSSVSSGPNQIYATDDNQYNNTKRPSAFGTQPTTFVDLFAEPPEDIVSSISSNQNIKRKTVNLFDEDEDDMTKHDLLTVLTKEKELKEANYKENKTLPPEKTNVSNKSLFVSKTSKSLFDDSDEDDDDFLKAFVKKSSPKETTKSTSSKTLLFDNEILEPAMTSVSPKINKNNANNDSGMKTNFIETHSTNKIHDIFDDNENNIDDLLLIKTTTDETENPIPNPKIGIASQPVKTLVLVEETVKKSVNSFNDFDEIPKIDNSKADKISKNKNLFDDLDEEDDLFSTKPKSDIFQQASMKDVRRESNSREDNEKSFEILQDKNSKDVNFEKEDDDRQKEIVPKDHISELSIVSRIETNNYVDNKSLQVDKKLSKNVKVFEGLDNIEQEPNKSNSATIMQNKSASVPENITQKLTSSNKYEFNSVLFLDEPPEDDNEFFETLAKTPNTFNNNYNAIDLENDVYEPDLPEVPAASTINNQSDMTEIVYTGLQLFSDIPPDDNDDDAGGRAISTIPSAANHTKRLHSVFYDDFNETLMALNQKHAEKEIPNQSVFSEEPPPINENLNLTSADIIDHKLPDNKQELNYVVRKTESLGIATKIEENTAQLSNKPSVSKLQKCDININVQALLPGAISTLRKGKENTTMSNTTNSGNGDIKSDVVVDISKETDSKFYENISKADAVEVSRTAETSHILPSFTKNRVKASAARRPSTRWGRQESYRKSLIEEQQQGLESYPESSKIQNEQKERNENELSSNSILESCDTNALSSLAIMANNLNTVKQEIRVTPSIAKEAETPQLLKNDKSLLNKFHVSSNQVTTTKLKSPFEDGEDEDDVDGYLFKTTLQQQTGSNKKKERNMQAKSQFKSFLDSESEEELAVAGLPTIISTHSTTVPFERITNASIPMPKNTNAKLFADSESDSDDLFGNLSSSKILTASTSKTHTKNIPQTSLFEDGSDSDDFLTTPVSVSKNVDSKNDSKNNLPKSITQTNTNLFSDLDSDEDDLFGCGVSKVKTKNAANSSSVKAPSTSKPTAPIAEFSKSKPVNDNPLADLL